MMPIGVTSSLKPVSGACVSALRASSDSILPAVFPSARASSLTACRMSSSMSNVVRIAHLPVTWPCRAAAGRAAAIQPARAAGLAARPFGRPCQPFADKLRQHLPQRLALCLCQHLGGLEDVGIDVEGCSHASDANASDAN